MINETFNTPVDIKSIRDFEELMRLAFKEEVSDVELATGMQPMFKRHGKLIKLAGPPIQLRHIEEILSDHTVYGQNAKNQLYSKGFVNIRYATEVSEGCEEGFRMHAACYNDRGRIGFRIAVRVGNSSPSNFQKCQVEDEIRENCNPKNGMVIVSGATGSGKSTLLSSVYRSILEDENTHDTLLTYEAPIEFVYDNVHAPSAVIFQHEVPKHVPSFYEGIESGTRSNPGYIGFTEVNNAKTALAAIEAGITGHGVHTTTHAKSVGATLGRFISLGKNSEESISAVDLISGMHLVVAQQLLPTVDGRLVAAREWLVFDETLKMELYQTDHDKWEGIIKARLDSNNSSMAASIKRQYQKKIISEDEYIKAKRRLVA